MGSYVILAFSVVLAAVGQVCFKKGMTMIGTFSMTSIFSKLSHILSNPFIIFGLIFFATSSLFWFVVLSRFDLSMVYPMVSVAYIIVAILSIIFFKETVSLIRWAGIFVICCGVFLISRS